MMVVIVVSRRVGQVTLVASERTSCRNLNGLKAIVDVIRVRGDDLHVSRNPNSPLAPSPLLKDEPANGLDCSGDFKGRAGYPRVAGRQQVAAMYCQGRQRSRYRRTEGAAAAHPAQGSDRSKSTAKLAGVAGLEPATPGFGDRCSTN